MSTTPTTTSSRGMDLFSAARSYGLKFEKEVLPESEHVVVDGFRLHYLDWGTVGLGPMLLLHGGGQTAHTWDFFALCMRNEYHVYALDQRGHGDSEWSPVGDYSTTAHQRDIEGFISHLRLTDDNNLIVVGLSMGGHNAFTYAAKNWRKMAGLVIVDMGPEMASSETQAARGRNRGALEAAPDGDTLDGYVEKALKFNPKRQPEMLRSSLLHNLRQLPNGKWIWKTDRRFSGARANPLTTPEAIERSWTSIRSIGCPTLIVRGAQSPLLEESVAKRMNESIPGSRFVTVPDAGHTVMNDNPPVFEAEVRKWLATLPGH